MSYLENKLCDNTYNYNKINPENIAYFFSQYGFYDKGVENIIKRINEQKLILNSHETDNLCIMDQVEKVNKDVRFPYPSNLLTALVYIRRISYLFMYEYGLDTLAKESELIPVMMEGLFIDYIKGSDNRIYLDTFYYHKDSGYITELKKLAGQTDAKQYNDFYTAYELQDDLVTYYKNNTKDFYKYLDKAKKDIIKEEELNKKGKTLKDKFTFFDIITIAKKANEKQRGKSFIKKK